jgi:hypothetical protein
VTGTTDTQSIRYGHAADPMNWTMLRDEADDIATQLDAADAAGSGALKRPVVRVSRTIAQLFSTGVKAGIAFQTLIYDTNGMTLLGTQPLRAAIVGANSGIGTYMLQGIATLSTTGVATAGHLSFWKNGVTFLGQRTMSSQVNDISLTVQAYLGTIGDYVEMHYQYDGTGTPNITSAQCWVRKVSL